jgi:(1->4)-alpha-D-glucan 1-alpha-D-glucosylmutase
MSFNPRKPESTYRLQFHKGFTFRDAERIVDYLADLGVTHVYASPYLAAVAGSTHGYDVIDHGRLNPEIGTREEYDAWIEAMRRRGMSHILDTVPNHVGVATNDNAWWNDVLAHGRNSKYAGYFDIAWEGCPRELHHRVLLPVLGAPYGEVLEKGELQLVYEDGRYAIAYYDRRFPLDPKTAPPPSADPARVLVLYRDVDLLDELLRKQHYRLAYWRVASDEINYRRFFDVNGLAALSMERKDVFDATHRLTFELLRDGKVAGLRIDHPDGLFDPKQYFRRLQERAKQELGHDLYVVAEKILAIDEPLPTEWPCDGTSGYDFLIMANGLFVDSSNGDAFTRIYDEWTGEHVDFDDLVYEEKKLILEISLASELHMLASQLDRIAQSDRRTQDFTLNGLHVALREVVACFPVYRSYVTERGVHESDVRNTERAVERAIARNPKRDPSAFRFVGDVVLLRSVLGSREDVVRFAGKFQQLTAPTTAKGIEDTAFYLYNRLVSLNEVGGEPQHFGMAPEKLHAYLADRQKRWPFALSSMSTHDTKRSEDVRARINVLSEMPDEWREHVTRWGEINGSFRSEVGGVRGVRGPAPSRNDEYLLYQTLIGAWPVEPEQPGEAFVERIQQYLTKAMREAKRFSSWTNPNEPYESAVTSFAASVIRHRSFLEDFLPFQQRVARFGVVNSLAQTLLKIAAPGVPDTYQGTELIDLSLVDPDNRRPVDYEKRRSMLARGRAGDAKLHLTTTALQCRRDKAPLFTLGEYLPLDVRGDAADHVFAFARRYEGRTAVCVIPRLTSQLGESGWGDARVVLPESLALSNVLTGQKLQATNELTIADALRDFPVALLLS